MSELLIIIGLILLNGVLAMSEIALISVRKSHLANEAKRGNKDAKMALRLASEPDRFLSTVQIGITVIGILTGIYSGSTIAVDFSHLLDSWGVSSVYSHTIAQTLIVVLVTYFTLILGELLPKRIGMSLAERTAMVMARPMYILSVIASPFVWILSNSTSFIFNIFGLKASESKVTEQEIKSMIQESMEDGEVQEVEQEIVERVFMLGDQKVSSLMTHRTEITCLSSTMVREQIKSAIEGQLQGVYPVVDKHTGSVEGIVEIKDLIFAFDTPNFNISAIIRPAIYFHENLGVYKALEKMKLERVNQALICDEFGSFRGMITHKDILEGLVGSINDTHSEPDIIKRKESHGWMVDGQCPFYDFLEHFEREYLYAENNFNTIGGLIIELLEHIPTTGEVVEWNDFRLEIVDMDGARIDKIIVTLKEGEPDNKR